MTEYVLGGHAKCSLLRALGLNPDEVADFKLDLGKDYNSIPTVTITKYVTSKDLAAFEMVMTEYRLVRAVEPVVPLSTGILTHAVLGG